MTEKKLSDILREDPDDRLTVERAIVGFAMMTDQEREAELELIEHDPVCKKRAWPELRRYLTAVHEAAPDVRKAFVDSRLERITGELLRRSMRQATRR
jgi:hypothetical protein